MGIIHTAKRFIVEELHEKLVNRMTFERARDLTERENQQVRKAINFLFYSLKNGNVSASYTSRE